MIKNNVSNKIAFLHQLRAHIREDKERAKSPLKRGNIISPFIWTSTQAQNIDLSQSNQIFLQCLLFRNVLPFSLLIHLQNSCVHNSMLIFLLHIFDLSRLQRYWSRQYQSRRIPLTNSAMWYLTELLDVLEIGAGAKAAAAPTSIRERADVSCIFAVIIVVV